MKRTLSILLAAGFALGASLVARAQTLSVTNGLTLQFKADGSVYADQAGTTAATDGSTVGLWKDAVGTLVGGDISQGDGSGLQPTFHTGAINGLPVVRFDGANDYLANSLGSTTFLGAANWTIFSVFLARSVSATGPEGYNSQAVFMDSGQNWGMPVRSAAGTPTVMAYSYSGINPPGQAFNTNQFTFAVARLGGGQISIQSAGEGSGTTGTVTSASGGATTGSGLRVGKGQGYLDGDVAELLFYNRNLTALEMDSVTSYLDTKYDLGLIPIPEPTTVALVCGAGLALVGLRLRRVRC